MKKIRRKLKRPVALGEILQDVLKASKIDINLEMVKLCDLWDNTVGPVIARNAQPGAIKGGLLVVHVSGASWMHHLQFEKEELIQKLNDALEKAAISDMRFKIGRL